MFYPLLTISSKSNLVGQSLKKKLKIASTVCMTAENRRSCLMKKLKSTSLFVSL